MSYRPEKSTSDVMSEVMFPTFPAGKLGEYSGTTTASPAMATLEKKNVKLAKEKDKSDERRRIGLSSLYNGSNLADTPTHRMCSYVKNL